MLLGNSAMSATRPTTELLPTTRLAVMQRPERERLLDAITTRLFREHFSAVLESQTPPARSPVTTTAAQR